MLQSQKFKRKCVSNALVSTDGVWESEKKMCSSVPMALACTSVPPGLHISSGDGWGAHHAIGEFSDLWIRGNNLNGINPVLPAQTDGGFRARAAFPYSSVTCPYCSSVQQISHMWLFLKLLV